MSCWTRRAPVCPFGHHGQVRLQYRAVSTSTYRSPASGGAAARAAVRPPPAPYLGSPSGTGAAFAAGRWAGAVLLHVMSGLLCQAGFLREPPVV